MRQGKAKQADDRSAEAAAPSSVQPLDAEKTTAFSQPTPSLLFASPFALRCADEAARPHHSATIGCKVPRSKGAGSQGKRARRAWLFRLPAAARLLWQSSGEQPAADSRCADLLRSFPDVVRAVATQSSRAVGDAWRDPNLLEPIVRRLARNAKTICRKTEYPSVSQFEIDEPLFRPGPDGYESGFSDHGIHYGICRAMVGRFQRQAARFPVNPGVPDRGCRRSAPIAPTCRTIPC